MFELSQATIDGSGTFDASILELFESLQQVSSELHREAIMYLTGRLFFWVFVSEAQPHMYLLQALHKHTQGQVLFRICRVRLEGLSVLGITHPGASIICLDEIPIPAYFKHSQSEYAPTAIPNSKISRTKSCAILDTGFTYYHTGCHLCSDSILISTGLIVSRISSVSTASFTYIS